MANNNLKSKSIIIILIIISLFFYFSSQKSREASYNYQFDTLSECNAWRDTFMKDTSKCWYCGVCSLTSYGKYSTTCADSSFGGVIYPGDGCSTGGTEDSTNTGTHFCDTKPGQAFVDTDNDGINYGRDLSKKGIIYNCLESKPQQAYATDYCVSSTKVREYYVTSYQPSQGYYSSYSYTDYLCEGSCADGICTGGGQQLGYEGDPCPNGDIDCANNYLCQNGYCTHKDNVCDDMCSYAGQKKCGDGDYVEVCNYYNGELCLTWKQMYTCSDGCSNGECLTQNETITPKTCAAEGELIFKKSDFNNIDQYIIKINDVLWGLIGINTKLDYPTICCENLEPVQLTKETTLGKRIQLALTEGIWSAITEPSKPEVKGFYTCEKKNIFDKLPSITGDSTLDMIIWIFIFIMAFTMLMNAMPRR